MSYAAMKVIKPEMINSGNYAAVKVIKPEMITPEASDSSILGVFEIQRVMVTNRLGVFEIQRVRAPSD